MPKVALQAAGLQALVLAQLQDHRQRPLLLALRDQLAVGEPERDDAAAQGSIGFAGGLRGEARGQHQADKEGSTRGFPAHGHNS